MAECILAGRRGPKGDTGPQGAQGPTGATGVQGPAGAGLKWYYADALYNLSVPPYSVRIIAIETDSGITQQVYCAPNPTSSYKSYQLAYPSAYTDAFRYR